MLFSSLCNEVDKIVSCISGRARRCYACRRRGHKADTCDVFPNASGSNPQGETDARTGREQQNRRDRLSFSILERLEKKIDRLEEKIEQIQSEK